MKPKTKRRLPFSLLIVAAVLVIIALIAAPLIQQLPDKTKVDNVLLTGAPFILTFIAIVLSFAFFIATVAARLNYNVSARVYNAVEALIIGGIVFGVVAMFQPWTIAGYQLGFMVLLFCMLAFNVWTHVTPKRIARNASSESAH